MFQHVRLVLALVAAAALAGCEFNRFGGRSPDESAVSAEDWVEGASPVAVADLEALWDRSKDVLANAGFAIDEQRTRYADRIIATRWNTMLSPQRFEGRRLRIWVRMQESGAGRWLVAAAVQGQRNVDIDHPSEPAGAKWEDIASDKARADVILYMIESGFREPGAATK